MGKTRMVPRGLLVEAALLAALASAWRAGAQSQPDYDFRTVNNVKDAMYAEQKFFGGCYKLLNKTGPVGCSAPSSQRVHAKLVKLEDLQGAPPTAPRAVLVSSLNATQYLQQLAASPQQAVNVVAVLVYSSALPASDSVATSFPMGSDYAVYTNGSAPSQYVWNPFGTGMGTTWLPVPVFSLADSMASNALWRASYNYQNDFKGASNWVEAELYMQATEANSTACLLNNTCLPLGGFNVWAAMPPLPVNATSNATLPSGMNTTLVVASLDSNGIFHDLVQAADAPLSGLIAMLTAMSILAQANQTTNYTRQLVFAGLAGEVWNYMGSKRLVWDLNGTAAGGTPFTQGLNLSNIDQVIEVGMVGRAAMSTNRSQIFLHTQKGATWGDTTELLNRIEGAAAISTDVPLNVSRASSSNPGLPPSSLYSFLRVKPSVAAVYIGEFDKSYINPYYQSSYDNGSFVTLQPLVSVAVLLARSLHAIAAPSGAAPLLVNLTQVTNTAYQLAQCIMLDSPGMSCALATSLLNPDFQVTDQYVSYAVKHYIGVLQYIHPDPQEPFYKKTLYRFLWNYMGLLSATSGPGDYCAFQANQCNPGYACIGWKGANKKNKQAMGQCYRSTVYYHPSLSTDIGFVPNAAGTASMYLTNASQAWERRLGWPADPLWVESNWPPTTPFIQILQRESASTEWAIFGGGIGACILTGLLSWYGRVAFEKHLKAL